MNIICHRSPLMNILHTLLLMQKCSCLFWHEILIKADCYHLYLIDQRLGIHMHWIVYFVSTIWIKAPLTSHHTQTHTLTTKGVYYALQTLSHIFTFSLKGERATSWHIWYIKRIIMYMHKRMYGGRAYN